MISLQCDRCELALHGYLATHSSRPAPRALAPPPPRLRPLDRLHRWRWLRRSRAGAPPVALRSAPLRALPPTPPAAYSARLPATPFAPTAQSPLRLTAECTTASAPRSPGKRGKRDERRLAAFRIFTPDTARCMSCPVCVPVRSLARLEPLTPRKPHGKGVFLS